MTTFYKRLSELCQGRDETPNAMARKLGIPSGSITAWKKGSLPRAETLNKLADYFQISADYLIGGREEKTTATDDHETVLKDTYFRLAKGAQDLGLDDEDVDAILSLYSKHKKRNE